MVGWPELVLRVCGQSAFDSDSIGSLTEVWQMLEVEGILAVVICTGAALPENNEASA